MTAWSNLVGGIERAPSVAHAMAALVVAGKPILRDLLPRRRVGDELPGVRADAGVAVERAHPDADRVVVPLVVRIDRRAARAAEPLLAAAVGLPHPQVLLARDDAERARCRVRVGG